MKKFLAAVIMLMMTMTFTACGGNNPEPPDKIKVIATTFPLYDWAREIIGNNDKFELTLLMDTGVDLHNFQPTAQDMMKISNCNVFIYVGGESDNWADDALKSAKNKDMIVVNLMNALENNLVAEEIVEGMEHHNHHHRHIEDSRENEEENYHHIEGYDEHIWLSLRNAQICCDAISDALMKVSIPTAKEIKKNDTNYRDKLIALDEKYIEATNAAKINTLCFGDRFPFRYMVDDYGLKYYAAFAGCSAESEASFATIKFLADKVDELKLPYVIKIEGSNTKIAETIIANTAQKNQQILTLDAFQATTSKDAANGKTYLATMEKNLSVLKKALEVSE
ncbi:MAG: metal ABC transporter substrate-binding protein [Selenomonadaceae bacterium]|nr:metal ABC transporter substrate-binding protein [Selenomonadaceae bacterium]